MFTFSVPGLANNIVKSVRVGLGNTFTAKPPAIVCILASGPFAIRLEPDILLPPVTVTTVVHVDTLPLTSVAIHVMVVVPIFNFTLFREVLPRLKAATVTPLKL